MRHQSRLDDLRRRVAADPASIAFAQLAEEYRRLGEFAAAVDTCRSGLAAHPDYVSARITLGRALAALGRFDEAHCELDRVLSVEPESVGALRGMGELHQGQGRRADAYACFARALGLAPYDAELEKAVAELTEDSADGAAAGVAGVNGQRRAGEGGARRPSHPTSNLTDEERVAPLVRTAATIAALEEWLSAIYVARTNRPA